MTAPMHRRETPHPAARRRRNRRLASAMKAAGCTFPELAAAVGCHPKTAERWYYEGRVPHPGHAQQIASALRTSPRWLWPSTVKDHAEALGDHARFFTHLDGEPDLIIHGIVTATPSRLDVCSGSGWFLERTASQALRRRNPVPVRVLAPPVITWNGACPPDELNLQFRKHTGVGQLSLLRGGDAMIVVNAVGMDAEHSPALFLSRACDGGAFDHYASGFEAMWAQAVDDEFHDGCLWRGSDA